MGLAQEFPYREETGVNQDALVSRRKSRKKNKEGSGHLGRPPTEHQEIR